MRRITMLCAFVASLGTAVVAEAAPRQRPCAEIRAACEQAGFVQGGAKAGDGIVADCIRPIMQGTPQPRRANKPLPQIDQQLVADCKAQNPNFGQRNAPPSQATEPPPASAPAPTAVPTPQTQSKP
jgi:hypothetical protein